MGARSLLAGDADLCAAAGVPAAEEALTAVAVEPDEDVPESVLRRGGFIADEYAEGAWWV